MLGRVSWHFLLLDYDEGVPDVGVGEGEGGCHTPGVIELEVGGPTTEPSHLVPQHGQLGDVPHPLEVSSQVSLRHIGLEVCDEDALRVIAVGWFRVLQLNVRRFLQFSLLDLIVRDAISRLSLQLFLQKETSN